MSATRRHLLLAVLGASALASSGCFFRGPSAPEPIELTLQASARLNPDDASQSLPTVLRILQLKSGRKMEQAEFTRVYRDAKEVLGEDLLAVDELVIGPGETVKRKLDRQEGAGAVAVVALFRRPTGFSWRVLRELPKGGAAKLSVTVEGYRVELR